MKERILVIEDSAAINELICINLETAGYDPMPFWDGNAVSEWLQDDSPVTPPVDLALLDVMLPGKDGFALLPELCALEIPVIFLTAKGDLNSKIHGLKDGAEDYNENKTIGRVSAAASGIISVFFHLEPV